MSSNGTVAEQLAAFIGALDYDHLSADVTQYGKTLLLDQLGCQLIGSTVDWNQTAYRFITENKSGGAATVVNYGNKVPVDDAVFVNGTFAQGCELDDYYDQGEDTQARPVCRSPWRYRKRNLLMENVFSQRWRLGMKSAGELEEVCCPK